MKTPIITILLFLVPLFVSAQTFEKAPVPHVKLITEWTQSYGAKGAKKGAVYNFDKNGLLTNFEAPDVEGWPSDSGTFEYDSLGRLQNKVLNFGYNNTITDYNYRNNLYIEYVEFKDSRYKHIYFLDKDKKLLEKKTYHAHFDSQYEFELDERIVYNYDKSGRLIGEMNYMYHDDKDVDKKKTIYFYYPNTKNVSVKIEYDTENKQDHKTKYEYNREGQITSQTMDFLNGGAPDVILYEYKNGQLWKEEHHTKNLVVTLFYESDKLIRKKAEWTGGATEITDYHYSFY